MDDPRIPLRFALCTAAAGAVLATPACLQAMLVLHPRLAETGDAHAAMAFALATALVAVPALIRSLLEPRDGAHGPDPRPAVSPRPPKR